jgi:transcriptional regulator with XRE-family HTH domain
LSKQLNSLVKSIEDLLHEKGWTKSELARRMSITPQSVNQFLSGKYEPSLGKAEKFAVALGKPLFYLLMSPEERKQWDEQGGSSSEIVSMLRELVQTLQRENQLLREKSKR